MNKINYKNVILTKLEKHINVKNLFYLGKKSDGLLRVGDCVLFFLVVRERHSWEKQSLLPVSRLLTEQVSSDAGAESESLSTVFTAAGTLNRPLRDLVCNVFCCCPVSPELDLLFTSPFSMQHEAVHLDFVAEAAFHLPCIPVSGVHINKCTI
jgi:hypothetical protein